MGTFCTNSVAKDCVLFFERKKLTLILKNRIFYQYFRVIKSLFFVELLSFDYNILIYKDLTSQHFFNDSTKLIFSIQQILNKIIGLKIS